MRPPPQNPERRLKVAIIGGGPGGLGAAIELEKLSFVDWTLYEKRPTFSEIGGGFTLQPQTWRLLEHNGAAQFITPKDYYRCTQGKVEERRNGRTGRLLIEKYHGKDVLPKHRSCRLARVKLQTALLKNVNQSRLQLSKRLTVVKQLPSGRVRIAFEDGTVDEVDLLIAADGIRSVVRKICFPDHNLRYNGQSVYRTIVSKTEVSKIDGIPWAPTFWKSISGLYVFTCPLGDDDFEVTARIRRPQDGPEPVAWGRPFDLHALLHEYDGFCAPVRQVLRLAAEGNTQEFALFSGPPMEHIISNANVAFIGDASHALLGNFGCGAGFALEDVYTLAKTLEWAWRGDRCLSEALELFDSVRSAHYFRLYEAIDGFAAIKAELQQQHLSIDNEIAERVKRIALASKSWMYSYEIDKAVEVVLKGADEQIAIDNVVRRHQEIEEQLDDGNDTMYYHTTGTQELLEYA